MEKNIRIKKTKNIGKEKTITYTIYVDREVNNYNELKDLCNYKNTYEYIKDNYSVKSVIGLENEKQFEEFCQKVSKLMNTFIKNKKSIDKDNQICYN